MLHYIFVLLLQNIIIIMGDIDDIYAGCSVEIDGYCLSNDVDDYDLYGEKMIGDNESDDDSDILFE